MASDEVRPDSSSDLVSRSCSLAAIDPWPADSSSSRSRSAGEWAMARSSCGSTPNSRTVTFAIQLSSRRMGRKIETNSRKQAGDAQRRLLRMGDRPRLRGHLADDHVQEHDDRQTEREPDDVLRGRRQRERLAEDALDDPGDGRFGDGTEAEGAHGDPELRTGQHQGELAQAGEGVCRRGGRRRRRAARSAIGATRAWRTRPPTKKPFNARSTTASTSAGTLKTMPDDSAAIINRPRVRFRVRVRVLSAAFLPFLCCLSWCFVGGLPSTVGDRGRALRSRSGRASAAGS